jgi:hypothetical protein
MIKKIKQLFRRGWMVKLKSTEANFQYILKRLRENQPFSFSRWGDGEWEAVLNLKDQSEANCDGHQYFDSMRVELQNIIKKKVPYMLGMQRLAYHKMMGRKIDHFLRSNKLKANDLWWVDADVFHDASMGGRIMPLFEELKKKNIILVGPAYLKEFKHFNFDFVEIPQVNAWTERERIIGEIKTIIDHKKVDAVLFCAGMTSNWFVDQLHGNFPGFILDIGSLLDPFVGKKTRNYHKKLGKKYQELNV